MESQITIACSPGTLNRVQNDNLYREQVTEKVLKGQGNYEVVVFSSYESANETLQVESTAHTEIEEIFIPNDSTESQRTAEKVFNSSDLTPDGKEKLFWSEAAVKLMISKIQELRPKVGKSASVKSKQKMYSLVSECMKEKDISFTPTQIENKFRSLERQYKATVLNNKQTGRSRQICPFESELSIILGNRRSVVPEFTLDSSDVEGLSRSKVLLEEVNSDTDQSMIDDSPSCSTQPAKKKRFSGPKEKLLNKVEELIQEKKDFHAKILEIMRKKEERELEKEKRNKRKLELLEQLVAQNKP